MENKQLSDDAENEFFWDLEDQWAKSQPRFTDLELLDMFGEALDTMDDKVAELKALQKQYVQKIFHYGKKYVHGEDTASLFARFCIDHFLLSTLQKVEKSLSLIERLRWLKHTPKNKRKNGLFPADIEIARGVSLVQLAEKHTGKVRRSGNNYIAQCPFHEDKTPSLYIYSQSNRFHCFGCGAHGDAIAFVRKVTGMDFKEAVYYLMK